MASLSNAGGRPPLRPRFRAAARPALVFSTINSRWTSSKAAVIWKNRRPSGVPVSILRVSTLSACFFCSIENLLNRIELGNRFTRAIAVGNPREVSTGDKDLLGEYDFSDEKLRDSVGIPPPKIVLESHAQMGGT